MQRVWKALTEVEAAEDLANWQIAGIHLWPILRMRIFRELTEQLGIFEKRNDEPEPPSPKGPNSGEFGQFVIVPFARKDASGEDSYSKRITQTLGAEASIVEISRLAELEAFFTKRYRRRALLAIAPRLRKTDAAKWARVAAKLEGDLAANLGRYRPFPRWALVQFYAQKFGFAKAFRKTEKLFFVNAWKRSVIAGAQSAGTWVVEPQHGLINNAHPLLSWPGSRDVAYLPNELYLWGPIWADASIPASIRKTVVGYDRVLPTHVKTPNSILVIGQVHHTERLLEISTRIAQQKPDYQLVYKPHPQEDETVLSAKSLPKNLRIGQKDRPALELIANSDVVIGVYSMALIEALAIGANVISLQLPGSETLGAFKGLITFAGAADKLDDILQKPTPVFDVQDIFAAPLGDQEFTQLLEGR